MICNVYKLLRSGTTVTKEGKVLERSNIAIPKNWVDEKNADYKNYGKWFEILEDETEAFYEKREIARKARQKADEIKSRLNDALTQAVEVGSKIAEKEFSEIEELRNKYEEELGKKVPARFRNDAEWIKSKLS